MKKYTVLIVEDDFSIREGVRILLETEGWKVIEAENGHEGIKKISTEVQLVILDVMMPGISGIKTCEEMRKFSNVPILFLTAKDQETDKLLGLTAGGDDYLTKPFSYIELLARAKALIRRHELYDRIENEKIEQTDSEWIELGNIKLHKKQNEVRKNEKEIHLTEMEYKMLLRFMKNPNQIFSVQNLYESVWEEPFLYSCGNTVMVHIRRLRQKIEDNSKEPKLIKSIWGKGYCFVSNY